MDASPGRRGGVATLPALVLALLLTATVAPVAAAAHVPLRGAATTVRLLSGIVPGSVDRTSLHLRATYLTTLRLSYGTRSFKVHSVATITNASGGPIDRVELNTAVARLGSMHLGTVRVDGTAVAAKVVDQTIVVPLGGVLPLGATTQVTVDYSATLRTSLTGSSWLFTKANGIVDAYRWLPWVSRQTAFDRPNHGDPFVTPVSALVDVTVITDRRLVIATTGDRVFKSDDGLTQRFVAKDVRDVTITAAPDFHTRETTVGDTIVRYYYRSSANAGAILDGAADAFRAIGAKLGDYPYPTFKVVQSAGGYGMESPRLIWVPYGLSSGNVRYLTAHETAHQWFYGLVGNDQSKQPFVDEAAADFIGRYVTGLKRSSRCSTGRLDKTIYEYTADCYYEKVYIQGGNLIDAARHAMGSTAFWAALKGYVAANRYEMVSNETLLDALDRATSKDLGKLLFAPRFPRIY
jgi:aminopeptidase N